MRISHYRNLRIDYLCCISLAYHSTLSNLLMCSKLEPFSQPIQCWSSSNLHLLQSAITTLLPQIDYFKFLCYTLCMKTEEIIKNAIIEYSKKCRKHCPCKKCEHRTICQDACRNCIIHGNTQAPGYCYLDSPSV